MRKRSHTTNNALWKRGQSAKRPLLLLMQIQIRAFNASYQLKHGFVYKKHHPQSEKVTSHLKKKKKNEKENKKHVRFGFIIITLCSQSLGKKFPPTSADVDTIYVLAEALKIITECLSKMSEQHAQRGEACNCVFVISPVLVSDAERGVCI